MNLPDISGSYVYRSLLNNPQEGVAFNDLEFGEGIMTLTQTADGVINGKLDMGSGYLMTLEGSFYAEGNKCYLSMVGNGVPGSLTNGWIYEYFGLYTPTWPNSIDQLQTITGSTIRAVDHNGSKAGVTATFYMVAQ